MTFQLRTILPVLRILVLTVAAAPALAIDRAPTEKPAGLADADWTALQNAVAKSIGQQAKLTGDGSSAGAEGAAGDGFGISVAISGDTALIGAYTDNIQATNNPGSAYVYTRSGATWTQQAKLVAADGAGGDLFGFSVALSGDTALVSAVSDDIGGNVNQGSAYVFTRNGSTWTQQAKLVAADGTLNDDFGQSVALTGDTALVGAPSDDIGANIDQGSVYVYTRSGNSWTFQAQLLAGDGAAEDFFGISVALSGDSALVGAVMDDVGANSSQGSAYVYTRSGTAWTQQAQLLAADGAAGDLFGWSVDLGGDTALVGAPRDNGISTSDQGSAYVYTRSGTAWTQQAKLLAGDGASGDNFGRSVALSGDTALIGAHLDDVGANASQGSAYVYTRVGTTWTQQAQLLAADGAGSDQFGLNLALSGETALLGAPLDDVEANANQGSVYAFTRSATIWTQQTQLTTGDGGSNDFFGYSVALSGDTALVGAWGDDHGANSDQGSAYVFIRSGATWSAQAKLVADDGESNDQFGIAVALSGDTALIGAFNHDVGANGNQGAAYVFTRSGTIWTQQAKLLAVDGASNDRFGGAVALSGDTALVGAEADDVGSNGDQGSAYVYTRSGANWTQQAKLVADDGAPSDLFGYSVALSDDTALVGARLDDVGATTDQGSAYVFTRSGISWTQQAKLVAGDGAQSDYFGRSVALSGDTALVGASADDVGANTEQGSAYIYTRSGTSWTEQAQLVAAEGAAGDHFGYSVALAGDSALVGAYANDAQGSVFVYTRNGTLWSQQARLQGADVPANDRFGWSVALSGATALVGAYLIDGPPPYGNGGEGAAYVFFGIGLDSSTTSITMATPDPSQAGDALPVTVTVSGDSSAPADGQVTVSASSGESCTDPTPSAGGGNTASFDCELIFASVGPRTLSASFSGSSTHFDSNSAAEAHAVISTLSIDPTVLADGSFGLPYSAMLSASGIGSSAPYTFAVTAGMLPPGLMLAGNGAITGSPLAAGGPFNFTVSATDSSAAGLGGPFSGSRAYGISIARADQAALMAVATPSTIPFNGISTLSASGGSGSGAISYQVTAGASFCSVVDSALTGTAVGSCTVTATKAADANYNAATATVDVEVLPAADLQISKSDGSTYAIPGGFVEYQILVGNAGPLAVVGARVEDPLPAGLTGALWSCSPVQGASCPAAGGSGGIDQLVDLPVNGVLRYIFSATVDAALGTTVTNTATVTVPTGTIETDASDNTSSDVNTVVNDGLLADSFESAMPPFSVPVTKR